MRVIAGYNKGKKLIFNRGVKTRPITDSAKEKVFSRISGMIEGKEILDLFAGTGAVGIEALSRGAKHATFVECNHSAISVLEKNLELCDDKLNASIKECDVFKFIKRDLSNYDVVFSCPPYKKKIYESFMVTFNVSTSNFRANTLVIVQCSPFFQLFDRLENMELLDEINCRNSIFQVWQVKA
jgi:16S rRNA (guanine(966)-N(2))-methyltransferase RsmD